MRLIFILLMAIVSQAHSLVVLQYHHVDDTTPASTSVSPDTFAQHLALIEEENMVVVDLEDAVRALFNGESLPERALAITFDDAYQSIYDNAFPLLRKKRWPFTVFVNTDAVSRGFPDMMTWEHLRDLYSEGAVIANHSQDHPYLIETPDGETPEAFWQDQIIEAEKRIFDEIGESTKIFAYPYGEYTLPMAEWLSQQGFIAFGQQSGAIGKKSHPQILPRFPASGAYANTDTLRTKLNTLAFDIDQHQAAEPVMSKNPPKLTLRIPVKDFNPATLKCYASGQGSMEASSKHQGNKPNSNISLVLQQKDPIIHGRGRYNCTAQSESKPSRYYWYSQLWINSQVEHR